MNLDKIKESAKAFSALAGTIVTALLVQYGPDGTVGTVLTVASIILTAVGVWATRNADPVVKRDDTDDYDIPEYDKPAE